jgi:hypothetical protein
MFLSRRKGDGIDVTDERSIEVGESGNVGKGLEFREKLYTGRFGTSIIGNYPKGHSMKDFAS